MNKSHVLFNPKLNGYLTSGALYAFDMVTPNPLFAHHYTSERAAELRAKQICDGKQILVVCEVSNPKVVQLKDVGANPPANGYVIEIKYKNSSRDWADGIYFRKFPYGWDETGQYASNKVYDTFNRGSKPKIWKSPAAAEAVIKKLEDRARTENSGCKYTFKIAPYTDVR